LNPAAPSSRPTNYSTLKFWMAARPLSALSHPVSLACRARIIKGSARAPRVDSSATRPPRAPTKFVRINMS
jgi:hypothetical protein